MLLAPAFWFARRWPEQLGEKAIEDWKNTGTMAVFHYVHQRPQHVWWNLIEDGLLYPPEPGFNQPALILHGIHDDIVPPSYSQHFAATRSNVSLRLLSSDHQLTDQSETIWKETSAFLLD